MKDMIQQCFQMISIVGEAKYNYIQSMKEAKNNHFEKAEEFLKRGDQVYSQIYDIQKQLNEIHVDEGLNQYQLLLMHAQDQAMSAEQFQIMAQEMKDCYARIFELEREMRRKS